MIEARELERHSLTGYEQVGVPVAQVADTGIDRVLRLRCPVTLSVEVLGGSAHDAPVKGDGSRNGEFESDQPSLPVDKPKVGELSVDGLPVSRLPAIGRHEPGDKGVVGCIHQLRVDAIRHALAQEAPLIADRLGQADRRRSQDVAVLEGHVAAMRAVGAVGGDAGMLPPGQLPVWRLSSSDTHIVDANVLAHAGKAKTNRLPAPVLDVACERLPIWTGAHIGSDLRRRSADNDLEVVFASASEIGVLPAYRLGVVGHCKCRRLETAAAGIVSTCVEIARRPRLDRY